MTREKTATPLLREAPAIARGKRRAWADALEQMSRVKASDPITAAAQVAGMGLAGYMQGQSMRDRDAIVRGLSMTSGDEYAMNLADEPAAYGDIEIAGGEPAEPRKKGRYEDKPYPKSWIKTDPRVKAGKNQIPIGRLPNVFDYGADPGIDVSGDGSPFPPEIVPLPNMMEPPIPGTDDYYEQRTGKPIDLSPAQPRRAPGGRFGGGLVPDFSPDDTGLQRTAADGGLTMAQASDEPPADGGKPKKMTDQERRVLLLAKQAATQVKAASDNFDTLLELRNLAGTVEPLPRVLGGKIPGGYYLMTPEGRIAYNSVSNIVANWLYVTSGATATDIELKRRVQEIMPDYGDDDAVLADKRNRLMSYVQLMSENAGIPNPVPEAKRAIINKYGLEE